MFFMVLFTIFPGAKLGWLLGLFALVKMMFCKLYLGFGQKLSSDHFSLFFTAVYVIKKLHLFCSVNASLSVF